LKLKLQSKLVLNVVEEGKPVQDINKIKITESKLSVFNGYWNILLLLNLTTVLHPCLLTNTKRWERLLLQCWSELVGSPLRVAYLILVIWM